jgi:hypothetical protein
MYYNISPILTSNPKSGLVDSDLTQLLIAELGVT